MQDDHRFVSYVATAASAAFIVLLLVYSTRSSSVTYRYQEQVFIGKSRHLDAPRRAVPSAQPAQLHCGNWQDSYRTLHQKILSGAAPPHYVISGNFIGLAGDLSGAVSVFIYALLTKRAFQWQLETEFADLHWAYEQPNINWTVSRSVEDIFDAEHMHLYGEKDRTKPEIPWLAERSNVTLSNSTLFVGLFHSDTPLDDGTGTYNKTPLAELFQSGDITQVGRKGDGGDFETVYMKSNYGFSIRIFDNPHHREELLAMGLTPETAFGCISRFLIQPKKEVFDMFPEETQLLTRTDTLKIGIQLRTSTFYEVRQKDIVQGLETGDGVLDNPNAVVNFSVWDDFFTCADQIEKTAKLDGQPAIWYIISDSLDIRHKVKERFKDHAFVRTDQVEMGHILGDYLHQHSGELNATDAAALHAHRKRVFLTAAAEHWFLSMCDFHVVSQMSGFGRTAGLLSLRLQSLFVLDSYWPDHALEYRRHKQCGLGRHDHIEELPFQWVDSI